MKSKASILIWIVLTILIISTILFYIVDGYSKNISLVNDLHETRQAQFNAESIYMHFLIDNKEKLLETVYKNNKDLYNNTDYIVETFDEDYIVKIPVIKNTNLNILIRDTNNIKPSISVVVKTLKDILVETPSIIDNEGDNSFQNQKNAQIDMLINDSSMQFTADIDLFEINEEGDYLFDIDGFDLVLKDKNNNWEISRLNHFIDKKIVVINKIGSKIEFSDAINRINELYLISSGDVAFGNIKLNAFMAIRGNLTVKSIEGRGKIMIDGKLICNQTDTRTKFTSKNGGNRLAILFKKNNDLRSVSIKR